MSQSFSEMQSGAEMREHIIGKAADDAEFRARLVADPKAVLHDELGVSLPDSFAISVHEDSSTHVHLVLPPTGQLDLAALEKVSAAHAGNSRCYAAPGTEGNTYCWD